MMKKSLRGRGIRRILTAAVLAASVLASAGCQKAESSAQSAASSAASGTESADGEGLSGEAGASSEEGVSSEASVSSEESSSVAGDTSAIPGVDLNHMGPRLKEIYDRGTLIVGNDSSYPPFGFIDPTTNQAVGVEREMASKIAEKLSQVLGKEIKLDFESMNFDAVLSSLSTGKIDLVCSACTVTEERKKVMDFSDPYLETKDVLLVRSEDKDKYQSLKDFEGAAIAANTGSSQEVRAKTITGNVTSTPTISDGILQLKAKKVDAVIVDNITGERYMDSNPDLAAYEISDEEVPPQDKAVAMQKGNEDLKAIVNQVVKEQTQTDQVNKWIKEYTEQAVQAGLAK